MHRRWRGARTALPGQRWSPPWPFVEPPPAELAPRWRSQAGRPWPFPAIRRSQTWSPPWPFVEPPPLPELPPRWRHRLLTARPVPLKRGQRWDAPPTDQPPAPSLWTVTGVGSRSAPRIPPRRGVRFDPPWPTGVVTVPGWTPEFRGGARPRSWLLLKRGMHWSPPWPAPAIIGGPGTVSDVGPPVTPWRSAPPYDPYPVGATVTPWRSTAPHDPYQTDPPIGAHQ